MLILTLNSASNVSQTDIEGKSCFTRRLQVHFIITRQTIKTFFAIFYFLKFTTYLPQGLTLQNKGRPNFNYFCPTNKVSTRVVNEHLMESLTDPFLEAPTPTHPRTHARTRAHTHTHTCTHAHTDTERQTHRHTHIHSDISKRLLFRHV